MRAKDEIKQEALFQATIKVVNEIGFAYSSVAKIAAEAGISPATLYIYHENKEDLLVSTYTQIKLDFSRALLKDFDDSRPIRDILETVWMNGFDYVVRHRDRFHFTEQFSNSPHADQIDKTEINRFYGPLFEVFRRGIEQKIIKDVSLELLTAFMIHPLLTLSNKRVCATFEPDKAGVRSAFDMAWDAIRR